MAGKTIGGRVSKPKPVVSTSSIASPRGAKTVTGMSAQGASDLTTATKTASAATTSNAIQGIGSFAKKSAPAPGPWESGSKVGKWEAGAVGQWQQAGSKTEKGTAGGGGGGPRPGGMSTGAVTAGNREAQSQRPPGAVGNSFAGTALEDTGYGAGGGGTGNPLAGVGSALQNTSIKTADLGGKSVEQAVMGAKRTRKTGAKRTQ